MKTNPEHVLSFIAVVEYGSFTRAARELHVSKSMVSKHIQALEDRLDVELVKRSTRQLVITDIGQAYYQQVKNIPEQLQAGLETIQPFLSEPKGILRVLSPANFAASLRDTVIPQFMTQYPNITLQISFFRPAEQHAITQEAFDVIILWKLNTNQFPNYNLIPNKLFSMRIGLYATADYLENKGTPQQPSDLLNHNCFSSIGNNWPFIVPNKGLEYTRVSGTLETSDDSVIQSVTRAGLGINYGYPFMYQDDMKNGLIKKVMTSYTDMQLDIAAFYQPSPRVPLKVRAFMDAIKTHYTGMQAEILQRK